MTGTWEKLGRVYAPETPGRHPKLASHAANPVAIHIEGDVFRVYFSGRDSQNRSSVGAVDIDLSRGSVIQEYDQPFFRHGEPGSFYADGVSIGGCYQVGTVRYMLFMGWQSPTDAHWRGDIGRLVVHPDLTLTLDRPSPFMGIHTEDPISLSYPWVEQFGPDDYRMWYGTIRTWDTGNREMLSVINSAVSANGHDWTRTGLAVPFVLGTAQAFSRPTVDRARDGGWEMWFSYRGGGGDTYRIGYARSRDGERWELALSETGLDVSREGWDSEMIEYPFVFRHKGRRYMLYNGNGYGRTGFGLAVQV
jgi:hypothetical protein